MRHALLNTLADVFNISEIASVAHGGISGSAIHAQLKRLITSSDPMTNDVITSNDVVRPEIFLCPHAV